jgi:SAM-dependent methyltransferase
MAGPGEFRVHDLADPISWLPDGCVDLVLCALAIEYVDDRVAALREFKRVPRPGGALVLSRLHYWLAPLQATCEEIYQAGFFIERLLEPRPSPEAAALEAAALDAADYELHTRDPRGFVAFRLVPRPA